MEFSNSTRHIIRYSVAATAFILLLFIVYRAYTFYSLSPDKLYAENYIMYELLLPADSSSEAYSDIEQAYKEKNFTEVIRLNAISVLSARDIFITGLSFLETVDAARAISSFHVVLADMNKDDSSVFKNDAEYYLALAFLKNLDFDQAIDLMNAIHDNPSHLYKKKFSRKFIRKVKMLKWR